MDYIELIKRFWQMHEKQAFTPNEAMLYFCLLEQCDSLGWKVTFKIPNGTLCKVLDMTQPTLIKTRDQLQQRKLIKYQPGASNRTSPIYTLTGTKDMKEQPKPKVEQKVDPPPIPIETETQQPPTETQPTETPPPPLTPEQKAKADKKIKYKYAENVTLTADEYATLCEKYSEEAAKAMIEILDNYKGSKGKKYKSDYRAILTWVVDAYNERLTRYGTQRQTIHGGSSGLGSEHNATLSTGTPQTPDRFSQLGTGQAPEDYSKRF